MAIGTFHFAATFLEFMGVTELSSAFARSFAFSRSVDRSICRKVDKPKERGNGSLALFFAM
jgi:hypothetical protein